MRSLKNDLIFEEVLENIVHDRTHSPYIVEITGLPKSGKTTIIRRLANILENKGLNVHIFEEAATEKVDDGYRSDLYIFNMLCSLENLRNVLLTVAMKGECDVVILDRGIYDSIVWAEFLNQSGLLGNNDKNIINNFFSLSQWFSQIDMIVYIGVSRLTYEARSKINSPIEIECRFNESYFIRLKKSYENAKLFFDKLHHAIRPEYIKFDTGLKICENNDLFDEGAVLKESNSLFTDISLEIADNMVLSMNVKSKERIAVVDEEWFNESVDQQLTSKGVQKMVASIFGRRGPDLYDSTMSTSANPKVKFIDRDEAEKNTKYVQLISAAFITRNSKYMVLQRSNSEKRESLRGKKSLIVSGHIDYNDQALTCAGNNEIENCLLREMSEELRYFDRPFIKPKYSFRVGNDEMGKRHYAFVYEVETNSSRIQTSNLPGAGDYESFVTWETLDSLIEMLPLFDDWSKRIIQHLIGERK